MAGLFDVPPSGPCVTPWVFGSRDTPRFKGVGYGKGKIIGKYNSVAGGMMQDEVEKVTLLKCVPAVADLLRPYLFVGAVPFATIAGLYELDEPARNRFDDSTMMHLIITEHAGKSVSDLFRSLAKTLDDDRLEQTVVCTLRSLFRALGRLKADGGCIHQDAKLDNVVFGRSDYDDKICLRLIDFEHAVTESSGNAGADHEGWGGRPTFDGASEGFDVHTAIESAYAFTCKRVGGLQKLRRLRKGLFGKTSKPSTKSNGAGHAGVYLPSPSAVTFEEAIEACTALLKDAI